jgi:phosphoribosyl-dephospho-CoA transferase
MNRHNLIYLDYDNCKTEICFFCKKEDENIIIDWVKNKNPVMVTRQLSNDKEKIDVGFMLPLEKNKKRVNFTIYKKEIKKYISEIKLKEILSSLDDKWQKPLSQLIESFAKLNLEIFVFGSSLWQYCVKEKYMREQSDVDLLWKPKTLEELKKGLSVLKTWMEKYPLKIDGEVILADKGCSWKELLNDDKDVIIKSLHGVDLKSKNNFMNLLEEI